MAAVTPSLDNAAEMLQKLALDSQPKGLEVHDASKKLGSLGTNNMINGSAKPFERAIPTPPPILDYINTYYAPHGYPSTPYYYGGYDGHFNEWNDYRYLDRDLADIHNDLHQPSLSSGVGQAAGHMGRLQPNNQMYTPFASTCVSGSGYGMYNYNSKTCWNNGWQTTGNRFAPKVQGNGFFKHGNENKDRMNELSKGPRSEGLNNQPACGSFKLAVKGQESTPKVNSKEEKVPTTPNHAQYNKEDFPENFSVAKFFVIKSYSEDDVHKSIKYSVWSSTPNGNKKLDAAYQEAKAKPSVCPVFLFFSVNSSGQFVGVAEMVGPVDFNKTLDFWQQDKWIGCFPVKWHIIKDVPNTHLKHIKLENNDNKPVTNSRDTQEIILEQGNQVLRIFKFHSTKTCLLVDFAFYEARETAMQDKKAKRQQYQKQLKDVKDNKDNAAECNCELKQDDKLTAKGTVSHAVERSAVADGNREHAC